MTPPSEMVERVARAMYDRHLAEFGDLWPVDSPARLPWDRQLEVVRGEYRGQARAAIEAITTPSDSELDHLGRAALCGWNNVDPDNETMAAEWERMGPATREAWMRAMRRALEAMREPTPQRECAICGRSATDYAPRTCPVGGCGLGYDQ